MSSQRISPVHDPILKRSPLIKDLSDLELNAVSAFLEPRKIKRGEVIFYEGSSGEEMYILISGTISAWVSRLDGSRHMMFEIKPGDFFGEMSVITNESRSATLTASTDSEILVFYGIDFYRIIYEHPIIGTKMLKAIRRVQNSWLEQTSRHLNDLMRWGETAQRRAVSDELTGLYNRRFLEESAISRFEQGAVGPRDISLLMMDMDRFHDINSKYGTLVGDRLFIQIADILRASTRINDICARLSGDEFAILLPDTGPDEALLIAERIRKASDTNKFMVSTSQNISEQDESKKVEVTVSISIGIASALYHADTWESLLTTTDNALRSAKNLGRNRVEIAAFSD